MKRFLPFLFLFFSAYVSAQLPGRVEKLEGLWEYKEGSGYERWKLEGDVMVGTSFRINKLGDTLLTEKLEIKSVNNRLVLNLEAYHIINDSIAVKKRTLIGKRRKMDFTSIDGIKLESLRYKPAFFSRRKLYLYVGHVGDDKPRKLVLLRTEDEAR